MAKKAILNRSVAPPIKDAIDFRLQLKPYKQYRLDNGIEVYLVDAGAEEVLQLECIFHAGNAFEKKEMVAATTNYLLKNGTSTKSAFAINEHFEYYGAYLNRGAHNEYASLSLHCLSKHIHHLLPVINEIINDSVFPEEELQIYRQNNKQRLAVNLRKSEFVAGRLIDEYVFGRNHPYGKYSTMEGYDALKRSDLLAFYGERYRHRPFTIFIAGKLPSDIIGQLNKTLGQDQILPVSTETSYTLNPAATHKYRIMNDESGVQGSIRLERPFPNKHHPDYTKASVLNCVLGGFFGSRLMSNIREDKGYTYGIHSYIQNHVHDTAWAISTEAGRDVCEATIEEVYKEMRRLREEPVGEDELLLVKNFMLGSTLGDLDGPFHIIGKWKSIVLNNLPPDYFDRSIATIKSVSAEALQELANRYFATGDFYELVVI